MEMSAIEECDGLFDFCDKHNKPILIEVDDLVHKLHDGIDEYNKQRQEKAWPIRQKLWARSSGFITSTPYLANIYSSMFNLPAYVFDNYIDFTDYRWNVERRLSDKIVIGWMGSPSHRKDLSILDDVIPFILNKYDNVFFKFVGYVPDKYKDNPKVKYAFTDVNDWHIDKYPQGMDFDIGLIPLQHNDFNYAKSDIKFLEYSRLKIASIVSDISTYKRVVNKKTGLVCRNHKPDDWIKAIEKLIEDKTYRLTLAENAYEYTKNKRTIEGNIGKYKNILTKVLDHANKVQRHNTNLRYAGDCK